MPRSADPKQFPHTTTNSEAPKPGDLVFGEEGLLAVLCIGPANCTGLLVRHDYQGVVDIPLDEYTEAFPNRVLVQESIHEIDPSTRVQ